MKKIIVVLPVFICVACAGNPPAWWNPKGRYGQLEEKASVPANQAAASEQMVVKEETLDPLPDSSYQEEALPAPVLQDTCTQDPASCPLPAPSVLE